MTASAEPSQLGLPFAPVRRCAWCDKPLPADARSDATTCPGKSRCREARRRFRTHTAETSVTPAIAPGPALAWALAPTTVAALYVHANGIYREIPGVDLWPEERDARTYAGPYPVVGHPPCPRWGRLRHVGGRPGEDGGCFAACLEHVERYGGVLEHPESSLAWATFGLPRPRMPGGWWRTAGRPGWACHIEQGQYGHPARKPTWLYYVGDAPPPPMRWGPGPAPTAYVCSGPRVPAGVRVMSSTTEREVTPSELARVLVALARESRHANQVADPSRDLRAKGAHP